MTHSWSRIEPETLRLIEAIAETARAELSGVALADHHRPAGEQLLAEELIERIGGVQTAVADDDLDDALVSVSGHPIDGRPGYSAQRLDG